MKLSINKVNVLLNVVLPIAIDGMKRSEDPKQEGLVPGETYYFAVRLKHRDILNRKTLKDAWDAFAAEKEKLSAKHFTDPKKASENHENFHRWKAEVEFLAQQEVEVSLGKLKMSDFQLGKNQRYPHANFNMLDEFGLIDFDVKDDDPADAPEAPEAAAAGALN